MLSILHRNPDERRNLWISFSAAILVHGVGLSLWILAAAAMLSLNQALLADLNRARQTARQRAEERVPTVFVEVDPSQAPETPPPETPNYSTQNSKAANPDPIKDTDLPKIDGSQDKMLRTVDVLRPTPEPAQPVQPEPEQPKPRPQPQPQPNPGDLTVASADQPVTEAPRQKPGSLLEARMRQSGLLAGVKSRQEGGVNRRGAIALDAKASPFGAYDATVIAAIQKRWYDLLDDSALAPRSGKVSIEFTMHYDGRVTDIQIIEQDVGEIFSLYCTKAISDPAPYPEWPSTMRQAIGKDHRDVRITFYYL